MVRNRGQLVERRNEAREKEKISVAMLYFCGKDGLGRFEDCNGCSDEEKTSFIDVERLGQVDEKSLADFFSGLFGSLSENIEDKENVASFFKAFIGAKDFLGENLNLTFPKEFCGKLEALKNHGWIDQIFNIQRRVEGVCDDGREKRNNGYFTFREARHILAILKIVYTQQYARENPVFNNSEERQKRFDSDLEACLLSKKREADSSIHTIHHKKEEFEIPIEQKEGTNKTQDRALRKLLRKSETTFEDIGDLVRKRFLINDGAEETWEKGIFKILKGLSRKGYTAIRQKTERNNVSRDTSRKELTVLLKQDGFASVEVQCMKQSDYKKSEAGAKNHKVYQFIQDCFIMERLYGYVDRDYVERYIRQLSEDNDVRRSALNKEIYSVKELKSIIWDRFNKDFFSSMEWGLSHGEVDNPYASYERTVKLRNQIHQEWSQSFWQGLAGNLGQKIPHLNFSPKVWKAIFNEKYNLVGKKSESLIEEGDKIAKMERAAQGRGAKAQEAKMKLDKVKDMIPNLIWEGLTEAYKAEVRSVIKN